MRRYEFFNAPWNITEWNKVSNLIFVNDYFKTQFESYYSNKLPVKTHLIYNSVDEQKFSFSEHQHGSKIAMVGYINKKKNLPLALSILGALPKGYSLHLIGEIQDNETLVYISSLAPKLKRKIILYQPLPQKELSKWLEDKNYVLNTAISEGNPNNINEAMAKGIKPIVHSWPGASNQYPSECVFTTLDEALAIINPQSAYESKRYKKWVKDNFSIKNIEQIKKLI
jgi:glycosyltransferase involved in cell wall biosynthesis